MISKKRLATSVIAFSKSCGGVVANEARKVLERVKITRELEFLGLELIQAAKLGWNPVGLRVQTMKIKKIQQLLFRLHLKIVSRNYGRSS